METHQCCHASVTKNGAVLIGRWVKNGTTYLPTLKIEDGTVTVSDLMKENFSDTEQVVNSLAGTTLEHYLTIQTTIPKLHSKPDTPIKLDVVRLKIVSSFGNEPHINFSTPLRIRSSRKPETFTPVGG